MRRRWTVEDVARNPWQKLIPQPQEEHTGSRPRKFRNIPTVYAGLRFDSKREAVRAKELILMEKAGLITDLVLAKRQLRFPLIVNGKKIGTYVADARYCESGHVIIEDVKGYRTREYRTKKQLMKALYDIDIRET
jgi:hypothetical protein